MGKSPGILDWFIDYIIKPIKEAIVRIPEPIREHILKLPDSKEMLELPKLIAEAGKTLDKLAIPVRPMTSAEAKGKAEEIAKRGEDRFTSAVWGVIAGEVASLGQLDIGLAQLLTLPSWRWVTGVATDYYSAFYRYGIDPMVRRFYMSKYLPEVPPAADLVRFALREVWLPERRPLLLEHYPAKKYPEFMKERGFADEFSEDYWAAHWRLPPIEHLNEMLYRGIIDLDTWMAEVRYNDYVPYAIPWLQKIIYHPYTRVDIRRMWDMRTVTEAEVLENYRWLGYDEEHAEKMTIWTKVYTGLPDLLARWKNGWITMDTVRAQLLEWGMPEERISEMIEAKIKPLQPERVTKERDLTKSEIGRLYKKGDLTETQAVDLITGLGYDEEEAGYILRLYDVTLRQRDLTPTQAIRAAKEGVMSIPTAAAYLSYLGYDDFEITVLFMLYDVIEKELIA